MPPPESEWPTVIENALRRVCSWRVPPNWSLTDWINEMRAHGASAVWQAVCDYDPSRGVPFELYARQRVWASALTHYRQEWLYALRAPCEIEDGDGSAACVVGSVAAHEWLRQALTRLSASESWLIEQLYWEGRTEVDVAHQLGITQQAVSKRKAMILRGLRARLTDGWVPGPGH